jgi:hypothetical protein
VVDGTLGGLEPYWFRLFRRGSLIMVVSLNVGRVKIRLRGWQEASLYAAAYKAQVKVVDDYDLFKELMRAEGTAARSAVLNKVGTFQPYLTKRPEDAADLLALFEQRFMLGLLEDVYGRDSYPEERQKSFVWDAAQSFHTLIEAERIRRFEKAHEARKLTGSVKAFQAEVDALCDGLSEVDKALVTECRSRKEGAELLRKFVDPTGLHENSPAFLGAVSVYASKLMRSRAGSYIVL